MKIVELFIDWDNQELEDLGVDIMSLVDKPAIGYTWQAFADIEEDEKEYQLELFKECGEAMRVDDVYVELKEFADVSITDIAKGIASLDILGKRDATREGVIKYRYAGPRSSNSRNFCMAMLNMNKLYTPEELVEVGNQMRSRFSSLYPERSRLANDGFTVIGGIGQWMGGSQCNHWWEMVEIFSDGRGPRVVVSKGKAPGYMGESMQERFDKVETTTWHFSDDDQMIITGPAMVADMMIPRKDENGEIFYVFFSADTVKKIAKKFIEENKQHNTDINHDDNVVQENTLLESWIVEDPKMDKSSLLGFDVPKNTWMVSYKINNEETWADIKEGKISGFSVAGDFAEKLSNERN